MSSHQSLAKGDSTQEKAIRLWDTADRLAATLEAVANAITKATRTV